MIVLFLIRGTVNGEPTRSMMGGREPGSEERELLVRVGAEENSLRLRLRRFESTRQRIKREEGGLNFLLGDEKVKGGSERVGGLERVLASVW